MWHVEQGGKQLGPFSDEQLEAMSVAKTVNAATLVWKAGYPAWRPLAETDFPFRAVLSPPPIQAAVTGIAQPPVLPAAGNGETLSIWAYFIRCITANYARFQGRARRKEYWSFVLFSWLFLLLAGLLGFSIDQAMGNFETDSGSSFGATAVCVGIASLLTLLPSVAVLIRRLHDIGLSGWLVLLAFIPYLGELALIIMALLPTQMSQNKHGLPAQ